ncbi:hypothetical protein DFH09DRAFT_111236 [Mycena vulgaris]|nr:hypothetical protein DFH09DRAFT_111236 [Mycena vulgaris]
MRGAILFETATIVLCARTTLAQVSNASCGPSYNWMLNSYQQNPCQVAAYLSGVCNPGESDVPALKPGDLYPGPTPQQSNSCRCSSVLYSLLSACAVCQSRGYPSWSIYKHNCSTVYPGLFLGDIPAGTAVEAWAYQNVTKYDGFNVSVAETFSATISQSAQSASPTSQAESSTPIPTQTSQNSALISPSESTSVLKVAWGVIATVCVMSVAAGLALAYKMWHRRKAIAPSAAYEHGYSPILMATSQNTLFTMDRAGSATNGSRSLPSIVTPASGSLVSLPSLLYDLPEPSTYSPAVESSDMFTSQGGHSPLTERIAPLSNFARLVPLRRPGGRW